MQSQGLMRLASRLAGPDEAEDLVQSAYLRAIEHDGAVRARPAWMRQVLVNEQRMHLRSRQRRRAREASVVERDGVDVEDVVHCLEVARIVGTLVDELDEDVRFVVRERYFDGDTAAAIARRHAIPAGTVRWRLKTGLDQMRQRLDAHYGGRRAMWVGGFATLAQSPTLLPDAASPSTAAGPKTAAAGKAMSVMSVKLLVGIGLVAATAGGAAVLSDRSDQSTEAEAPPSRVAAAAPAAPAVKAVTATTATPAEAGPPIQATAEPSADTATSQQRRAKALAEHAKAGLPGDHVWVSADDDATLPSCEGGDCLAGCTDTECIAGLATEFMTSIESCRDFFGQEEPDVSMIANVIGAPDVGTIVGSVDLDLPDNAPPELAECLTETMYALKLGEPDGDFEQEVSVLMRSKADVMGALDLDALPAEKRAEIEAALNGEHGDGPVRIMRLNSWHDEAPPQ